MVPIAWTSPKTWGGSEVLTSVDINAYLSDNTEYLYDNCPETSGYTNQGTFTAQTNNRIEFGYLYIGITTSSYGSAAVTFNQAFAAAPAVMVTEGNLANAPCRAGAVGTGGFTLSVYNGSGGTMSGSAFPRWLAIGA